jgi:enoyl-CoA hydratase/carnithine racemase
LPRSKAAHAKVGLAPDGGATAFLAPCKPRQLMTELRLSGDRITAERNDTHQAAMRSCVRRQRGGTARPGASLMAQSRGAPEAIEGIGAFLEKRAPAFAARRRS